MLIFLLLTKTKSTKMLGAVALQQLLTFCRHFAYNMSEKLIFCSSYNVVCFKQQGSDKVIVCFITILNDLSLAVL